MGRETSIRHEAENVSIQSEDETKEIKASNKINRYKQLQQNININLKATKTNSNVKTFCKKDVT